MLIVDVSGGVGVSERSVVLAEADASHMQGRDQGCHMEIRGRHKLTCIHQSYTLFASLHIHITSPVSFISLSTNSILRLILISQVCLHRATSPLHPTTEACRLEITNVPASLRWRKSRITSHQVLLFPAQPAIHSELFHSPFAMLLGEVKI